MRLIPGGVASSEPLFLRGAKEIRTPDLCSAIVYTGALCFLRLPDNAL